jgi:dihydrofolate reductase
MRKLKLQMVTSIDGFVKADYEGGEYLNWDTGVSQFCIDNLDNVDTILVGGKNADDFIPYWKEVANDPANSDHQIGKLLTDIPKIVFSRSTTTSRWSNATMASGDLINEVQKLKKLDGKDMIVYGGYTFVSALIGHGLVDEYYLLTGPVAYGSGKRIFNSVKNLHLKLMKCHQYDCGIVLLQYQPKVK